jgi:signal transduction histidine kinase
VDVSVLVNEAVRLLKAAMLIERVDIRVSFGSVIPPVSGDPVQLEQVLLNVLLNACEAIAANRGGPRMITIRIDQQRRGHVKIEIVDTGVGADKGELEHMFEHFVSTKPKGLGMGLAISRSIIHAHGGSIWATANPELGLTVHIELPCAREVGGEAAANSENAAATAPASR